MTAVTTLRASTPTAHSRWMGAGSSSLPDSAGAGAEAARSAIGGDATKLVLVYASVQHDLRALVDGVASVAGDAPIIGCSTAGEIAGPGPSQGGVVVAAIGGDGFAVSTAAAGSLSADPRAAGAAVARCAEAVEEREHRLLLLLSDGLGGDQQELVRGAYSVVGAEMPLVGGCAGDDLRMRQTFQVHCGDISDDSVVAAAITADSPFGIGVQHGWRRVGDPMLVTESRSNHVFSIDERPALDAYLDRLDAPAAVREDPTAFTRFAVTHPLGLSRRSGEEVRFIGGANFDERSLMCIAEVPQGALAWLMEGDAKSVLDATDSACMQALAPLGGREPIGLLAFDCIARRDVLGAAGILEETARLRDHAGEAPIAGFYTYGEIARTHGVSGFHNQTLVVLAFG